MPEFDELAAALRQAREQEAKAARDVAVARERFKRTGSEEAAGDLAARRAAHAEALARAAEAVAALEPLSDPRDAIAHLDDRTPILLMPVRLETRFLDGELLVRVYPDDCSIDTFEELLSEDEVRSARLYWTGIWEAGGIEQQERGAWRGLVAAHGSGRAQWIVAGYRPLNVDDRPTKAAATDVILAIPTDAPLEDEVAVFWRAVWLADGDREAEEAALQALEAAVGAERAAEIVKRHRPANLAARPAPPLTKEQVAVSVAFVVLPAYEDTKDRSWTRAPEAALMPDRFVFLGYAGSGPPHVVLGKPVRTPLVAGPDPSAPPGEQIRPDDGDLLIPDPMRWMVDFDAAVEAGMGLRVDLEEAGASGGFDRVLVLGVRLSADAATAQQELETLLEHHRLGRSGFGLAPVGLATNNTEDAPAAHVRGDDPDASFDLVRDAPLFADTPDWRLKRDGQWLAEYLGIDSDRLKAVAHAGGADQADARAMNAALWPATLGYWMETMMAPVLDPEVADVTRQFFTRFVSGRGAIPGIRIGRQPYGICPATAFSRLRWPLTADGGPRTHVPARGGFLPTLYRVLLAMDADWATMAGTVAQAGGPGDPHATLLDIVGLHPASVEWSQRWAEGVDELYNRLNLQGLGWLLLELLQRGVVEEARELLRQLGYQGEQPPEILGKLFFGAHNRLQGPVVDDRPLSETEPVHDSTTDGRNYLEWLVGAARTSLDALYRQQGFVDDQPPRALLYLLLRHALQLGYHDVSVRLHESAGLLGGEELRDVRRDRAFIHVEQQAHRSESRYRLLYATEPAITGSETLDVGEFIGASLAELEPAWRLREQVDALERLAGASTARLERAFADHVDCCSYRLDAWRLGLVHLQLASMRDLLQEEGEPRRGIHLGAYAWLEDLRPESRTLTPVELDEELAAVFEPDLDPPLRRDSANQGYIHAPSLNQAVAAAVLRAGYLADASAENPATLAVNLTSERVRRALGLLEGVRAGQSLGALLGYQLERGLHDRQAVAEVDRFILDLRRAFPLAGDRLGSTSTAGGQQPAGIEAVEARNVADGLALVEHIAATGQTAYPFGKELPPASPAEAAAITAEVDRLLDAHDAVADLALAEGVYQAVLGNYDRVASTYDAYAKGNFPPEPEVVRTPAAGIGLTHRVALHLEAGLDPAVSPVTGVPVTPRAHAEPALNRWLATVLPPLGEIGCSVTFRAAATGSEVTREVTIADLDLQPLDLLALLHDGADQAMSELDDRIVRFTVATHGPRPDVPISIAYMETMAADFPVFEVLPLVRALRPLVTASRPLRASDLALTVDAKAEQDAEPFVDAQRVAGVLADMQTLRDDLDAFHTALREALDDEAALVENADATVAGVEDLLPRAAAFGVPQAGWGFAEDFRRRLFAAVLEKCAAVAARWTARLAEFDALMDGYDDLTSDDERFALLLRVRRLVSTAATPSLPADPDDFKDAVLDERAAFAARRDGFAGIAATTRTTIGGLLDDVSDLLPVSAFDLEALTFEAEAAEAVRFAQDAAAVAGVVLEELRARIATAGPLIDQAAASAAAAARVEALSAAAKALLGEEFTVVPEFELADAQADALEDALAASEDGTLFAHLATLGDEFPVDTWLYGVARVRDKLRAWEQVVMFSGAAGRPEPELTALQLPFRPGDRWLALQFPADTDLGTERLLYTAHFATPFDKTARQCGLLLDEWPEVIPGADADTGLAFQYDRPSSEPPQAMLLVTPASFTGSWRWDDLVDAVGETLELAKRRAVEPVHVDASPYAPLLPATVMAMTVRQLTISANLALNNDLRVFTESG